MSIVWSKYWRASFVTASLHSSWWHFILTCQHIQGYVLIRIISSTFIKRSCPHILHIYKISPSTLECKSDSKHSPKTKLNSTQDQMAVTLAKQALKQDRVMEVAFIKTKAKSIIRSSIMTVWQKHWDEGIKGCHPHEIKRKKWKD